MISDPPKLTLPEARGGLWNFGGFQAPILTLGHDCMTVGCWLWLGHHFVNQTFYKAFCKSYIYIYITPSKKNGWRTGAQLASTAGLNELLLFSRVLLGPVSRARNDSIAQVVVMRNSPRRFWRRAEKIESNLELNLVEVFFLLFTVVNHH